MCLIQGTGGREGGREGGKQERGKKKKRDGKVQVNN